MAFRRHKKSHLNWLRNDGASLFLNHTVSHRHPGPQVPEFEQGLNENRLDDPAANLGVFKTAPGIGAVSFSLEADFLNQGEEGLKIPWLDHIFDREQNW